MRAALKNLSFIHISLVACGLTLPLSFPVKAEGLDWYRWRGPDLNGVSTEKGWKAVWPKEGPKQLWKASVGIGFSSISVKEGRAYTLGNQNETDTVYCLDANTGKILWRHSYPSPLDVQYYEGGTSSTPTIDGKAVFTLSKRGHLFCFEAGSGQIIWQKNIQEDLDLKKPRWGFAGSPLVEGDLLVLNAGSAGTALQKTTGKVVWTSGQEAAGYASPVPFGTGDRRGVAIFAAKALVGVNLEGGRELWRQKWLTQWDINIADPIISSDKIFVSTFDQGCAVFQINSGNLNTVWQNRNMANHFSSCVLVNRHLYGFDGNTDKAGPELRCLDFETGALKWVQPGLGLGALMAADNKLIVLTEKGELIIVEATSTAFKPISRAQVLGGKCWTTPVLSNGKIYCRNSKGDLVCLDVKE
jgi:outer membrane protein assembly factor BamB